jgi:predicted nucleic acid-binding protein
MYLDAAYVAKYYVNEPDSPAVRRAIRSADSLLSSTWSIVEVTSALHRHLRQGSLGVEELQEALALFREDAESGFWTLIPVSETLFWRVTSRVATVPARTFLRAGDAVQLASAIEAGESEIWTAIATFSPLRLTSA